MSALKVKRCAYSKMRIARGLRGVMGECPRSELDKFSRTLNICNCVQSGVGCRPIDNVVARTFTRSVNRRFTAHAVREEPDWLQFEHLR